MFAHGDKGLQKLVRLFYLFLSPPYAPVCPLLFSPGPPRRPPITIFPAGLACVLVQVESKYPDQIKVFYSATCDSIEQLPGGGGIEVRASLRAGGGGGGGDKGEGETKVFRPRLLVGADGLNSKVRGPLCSEMNGQGRSRGALWLRGTRTWHCRRWLVVWPWPVAGQLSFRGRTFACSL